MKNSMIPLWFFKFPKITGKLAIEQAESGMAKNYKGKLTGLNYNLMLLENAALNLASKRHSISKKEAHNYIGKEFNNNKVQIGYHVKGQTVIASRVPGDGPHSTGVFEIIGFHKDNGNHLKLDQSLNLFTMIFFFLSTEGVVIR